jgi:hypothetical protein
LASLIGIKFNYNGRFNKALEALRNQANRAMFALIGKCKKLCLPVDIQLQLFDALVKPILFYRSEVWGYEKLYC